MRPTHQVAKPVRLAHRFMSTVPPAARAPRRPVLRLGSEPSGPRRARCTTRRGTSRSSARTATSIRAILADNAPFPEPTALLIMPDHYIFRMLYSRGVPHGVARRSDARRHRGRADPREDLAAFADHYYLFRGTPTGAGSTTSCTSLFGVREQARRRDARSASTTQIAEKLASPEFRPRALFERFNIEVLATTDAASDPLEQHRRDPRIGLDGARDPDVPARRRRSASRRRRGATRSRALGDVERHVDHRFRIVRRRARGRRALLRVAGRDGDGPRRASSRTRRSSSPDEAERALPARAATARRPPPTSGASRRTC